MPWMPQIIICPATLNVGPMLVHLLRDSQVSADVVTPDLIDDFNGMLVKLYSARTQNVENFEKILTQLLAKLDPYSLNMLEVQVLGTNVILWCRSKLCSQIFKKLIF